MRATFLALLFAAALGAGAQAAAAPADEPAAASAAAETLGHVVPVPGVEVSTARAGERAPVARSVIARDEIQRLDWGQDTPMALATLPNAYAYSDAGNGVGYSYLSIRGFPQRRISVLLDGVPLNDPESHEVYWIDHPDLLASTSEAQLQRGVGTALYGAASLGGSVNLDLAPFQETPHVAASLSYGTWNTKRLMLETDSGALPGGWNVYGRYSRIESDGYRDQSDSRLWSYTFAARRVFGGQSVRVQLFGGPEETHLSYLGIPSSDLHGDVTGDQERDRRFNPLGYPGERDHFFEPHYELLHTWGLASALTLSQTLFWFDGRGYYDEQRFANALTDYRLPSWTTTDSTLYPRAYYAQEANGALAQDSLGRFIVDKSDIVRRRWIQDHHYGWVPRLQWRHAGGALTVGGEMRWHDGHHVGTLVSGGSLPPGTPADWTYYDFHPRTFSGGLFAREEWSPRASWLVTADLAWRHQDYSMRKDRFTGVQFDQPYDFGVPRLGVTWTPRPALRVYASYAYAGREPSFQDLYDAEGGGVPLFRTFDPASVRYSNPLLGPEHVHDLELGGSWSGSRAALSLGLFRMDFRDELIPYEFNADVDTWTPINAARSLHQGVEAAGRFAVPLAGGASLDLRTNASLDDNHFVRFLDVLDATTTVSRDGNPIPFFPAGLVNGSGRLSWRGASLGVEGQYVGRIYVDNSESTVSSIGPHAVFNVTGGLTVPAGGASTTISVRVLNVLDRRYETAGYMDYDAQGNLVPMLTPAATRGVLGEVRVEF